MKKHTEIKMGHSLNLHLVVVVLSIILPFCVYLLCNNFYAIGLVRQQAASSSMKLLTLYMQRVDQGLNDAYLYLLSLSNEIDLQTYQYSDDDQNRLMAKTRLFNKMKFDIGTYGLVDSFFIYQPKSGEFLAAYGNYSTAYNTKEVIKACIIRLIEETKEAGGQVPARYYTELADGRYYFQRLHQAGDAYIGTWGTIDNLVRPLDMIDMGSNGVSLFVTEDRQPMNHIDFVRSHGVELARDFSSYYTTGSPEAFLAIGKESQASDFSLVALIPSETILEGMIYFTRIATFILIAAICAVPMLLIVLLRLSLVRPLKRISAAMESIHGGNIDSRVDPNGMPTELFALGDAFNVMMDQIHALKINIYEEQLNKQREELDKLRLQINPHFFMNSLNIIYSLAQMKNYALIQEMSYCLTNYYSYISRKSWDLVRLSEELEQVKHYLRILELRYPDCFTYSMDTDATVVSLLVPPLLIQTFVENAVKYAVNPSRTIHLSVTADTADGPCGMELHVKICNTGSHIDERILDDLRTGRRVLDAQGGEHIGIANVRRRLELLYHGRARLSIQNEKLDGVMVDIALPLEEDNKEAPQCTIS